MYFCRYTQQFSKILKISLWVFLVTNSILVFLFLYCLFFFFFVKVAFPCCNLFPLVSFHECLLSLVVHIRCLQIYGEVWWFFVAWWEEICIKKFKTYRLAFIRIDNPYVLNFFKNYNFLYIILFTKIDN